MLAALVLAIWGLRRVFRSDEDRISEAIDEARDALVAHRRDEFLAHFEPEVRYQGTGTTADMKRDLDRWDEAGLRQLYVAHREIEVEGDAATVRLEVVLGAGLRDLGRAGVDIVAEKREGVWRVRELAWRRTAQ